MHVWCLFSRGYFTEYQSEDINLLATEWCLSGTKHLGRPTCMYKLPVCPIFFLYQRAPICCSYLILQNLALSSAFPASSKKNTAKEKYCQCYRLQYLFSLINVFYWKKQGKDLDVWLFFNIFTSQDKKIKILCRQSEVCLQRRVQKKH